MNRYVAIAKLSPSAEVLCRCMCLRVHDARRMCTLHWWKGSIHNLLNEDLDTFKCMDRYLLWMFNFMSWFVSFSFTQRRTGYIFEAVCQPGPCLRGPLNVDRIGDSRRLGPRQRQTRCRRPSLSQTVHSIRQKWNRTCFENFWWVVRGEPPGPCQPSSTLDLLDGSLNPNPIVAGLK